LAAAIDDDTNEFASHALWLLLLTGVRRSEILAAKWADIDWDNKTLYVGKTKNGEPVLAPLSRAAIARLKLIPRLKDNPYIICGALPGKPLAYIDRMWRRVRKDTGFMDLRIHDLRRTVGSWLVRDGASLHLVGAVLNHKDQKTTAGYAYFQTKDRHKALDRHGKKLVQIASGGPGATAKRVSQNRKVATVRDKKQPRIQRISRPELYNLIWSEPITALAKKFGLSDRGLTKVCRRSDIPAPPRGYWARIAARGVAERPDLPCREDLDSRKIRFRVNRNASRPSSSCCLGQQASSTGNARSEAGASLDVRGRRRTENLIRHTEPLSGFGE